MQSPMCGTKNIFIIDFENTQKVETRLLQDQNVWLYIVLGPNQKTLDWEFVRDLLPFGARISLVSQSQAGKNAVDFRVAYLVGQLSVTEEDYFIHIVSADKGFDPLIADLKREGTRCERVDSLASCAYFRAQEIGDTPKRIEFIVERLRESPQNRPSKVPKMRSYINSQFSRKLSDDEVDDILGGLMSGGFLTSGSDLKVAYSL